VDVITGLKAMTIWPAFQHFEEASKGSLEVGKLADFVILSADPTKVEPRTIADIQVVETIKEGVTVFRLAPTGSQAAGDRSSETFAWTLQAMAHPGPADDATRSPDRAHASTELSTGPADNDRDCQSDVILRLVDAMARGG
jgi:hypothetical protein